MKWQDAVLSVVGFLFSIVLIPTLRGKDKPALSSALLTAFLLMWVSLSYATLHLWLGFTSTVLNCIVWATLAVQRLRTQP